MVPLAILTENDHHDDDEEEEKEKGALRQYKFIIYDQVNVYVIICIHILLAFFEIYYNLI